MSFWLSYVGIGFAGRAIPYFDDSRTLLFSVPVVVATLLLPAAALGGFVWTRRWRYGPFFLGLALVAVLVMRPGSPTGTPLRHGLYFVYNHVAAVRFLRASYKAAPLLARGAGLPGRRGADRAVAAAGRAARAPAWWRAARALLAGAAVLVVGAWPLVTGRAQDAQVSFKRDPGGVAPGGRPAGPRAARPTPGPWCCPATCSRSTPGAGPSTRSCPRSAAARWPSAPRSPTPICAPPSCSGRSTRLVHQQRLLPGQLPPLLSLIGVRSVVTGTDDDLARSDAPAPADAAATLSAQPGFARPARTYGPLHTVCTQRPRAAGRAAPGAPLRPARPRAAWSGSSRGPRRSSSTGRPAALAGLAAFGALPDRPRPALLRRPDARPSCGRELATRRPAGDQRLQSPARPS